MSQPIINVLTVCGSLRTGSHNAAIARTLPALAPAGMTISPAPAIRGIPLYDADIQYTTGFPAEVVAWADAIRAADGVVIVSPEYNWSIPGTLKNAIDWVSRMKEDPFKGKPIALQSAATGMLGGGRMQYHLRQVFTALEAVVLVRPEVFVNFASQKFDEKTGELKDEATKDIITQQLVAFEKLVRRVGVKA